MANTSIYGSLFRSPRFTRIWSDEAHLSAILRVEAELAMAEAQAGVIPQAAADLIASCCRLESLNIPDLSERAARDGNVAISLVAQLRAAVRAQDARAASWVHWGATSQDVLDTATVLQMREHLDLQETMLTDVLRALAALSQQHRGTVMLGRTWLQPAVPITFGLKAAGWLDALVRHWERLRQLRERVLAVQFGGAAGTLASLGSMGVQVAQALAAELKLTLPDLPWHTHRDRMAEAASFQGLLAGTLGKVARDLSLCMQAEVGELSESAPESYGGSSTMPNKQNPVACAVMLAAAYRVPPLVSTVLQTMVQEHERGLGNWPAEWEVLPELCGLTGGALHAFAHMLPRLEVHAETMRRNLDATRGLAMAEAVSLALAASLGRDEAHALLANASRAVSAGHALREALEQQPLVQENIPASEMDALFDPARYLGAADAMIDAVLRRFQAVSEKSPS